MKTKRFNVKTKQFEEIDFKLDPTDRDWETILKQLNGKP